MGPKSALKKICYFVLTFYLSFSAYTLYKISTQSSRSPHKVSRKNNGTTSHINHRQWSGRTLHIWGKAAIAEFFWLHIFQGSLVRDPRLLKYTGSMTIDKLKVSYTTGPSLKVESADTSVTDLVIVLNGREESKVNRAKKWLDALHDRRVFHKLRNLGIVLLGNEMCGNEWLWEYVESFAGLMKFIFIVYDVEEKQRPTVVRQWPLGVATYRNFPLVAKRDVNVHSVRKHRCNFLGTVYPNSSRAVLHRVLKDGNMEGCFVKVRYKWWDKETEDSMSTYHDVLKNSDLTLCPVGVNSESYRIYEAMSYGSVPVLEDVMTPGRCGRNAGAPYSLLKKYKAPVIFIKQWTELPRLLKHEKSLLMSELIERRKKILDWYDMFRYKMREDFLTVTKNTFR